MPALVLIVLFIVVPLAELALIIQVGQAIGVIPTIAILLADSILGGILMRAQGRAAWRRFNEAMSAGRVPHREALDGGLVIFGGALLLTPGFLSDVLGLLLLIPPTRLVARRIVGKLIARRMLVGAVGLGGRAASRGRRARGWGPGGGREPARPGPRRHYDVEGTATEAENNGRRHDAPTPRLDR
jgi:UPF0716 protein FxsA